QTREVVQRLTGQDAYLFRPPGGDYSRRIVRLTSKAGYKMVLWSVLSHDVEGATPAMMRHRILNNAEDGGIVLLHSGMQSTIDMFPDVIAQLRARGYHFVTVSTLMGLSRTREPEAPVEGDPRTAGKTTPLLTASNHKY